MFSVEANAAEIHRLMVWMEGTQLNYDVEETKTLPGSTFRPTFLSDQPTNRESSVAELVAYVVADDKVN
jgi:hypothetical protein